ncbi:hypothetical protein, partial [Puniceicoccus vermicola]|uniref:hypothetical protein n=1 Tax=Puniceicoccus vermicola TaxID=388746 RepID=UPI001C8CAE7A
KCSGHAAELLPGKSALPGLAKLSGAVASYSEPAHMSEKFGYKPLSKNLSMTKNSPSGQDDTSPE